MKKFLVLSIFVSVILIALNFDLVRAASKKIAFYAGSTISQRQGIYLNGDDWKFLPVYSDNDKAINEAIIAFKDFLRNKGYTSSEIDTMLAIAEALLTGKIKPEDIVNCFNNPKCQFYNTLQELVKKHPNVVQDLVDAYNSASPVYMKTRIESVKIKLKTIPKIKPITLSNIRVPSPWKYVGDFKYPAEWREAIGGWYYHSFDIPQTMQGQRIKLHFEAVSYVTDIYVNGEKLKAEDEINEEWSHFGGYMPFDVDITKVAKIGQQNTIIMAVGDGDFARDSEDYNKYIAIMYEPSAGAESNFPGSGIWQDVSLKSYPKIYVKDVFVKTYVKRSPKNPQPNNKIELEIKIKNEDTISHTLNVENQIKEMTSIQRWKTNINKVSEYIDPPIERFSDVVKTTKPTTITLKPNTEKTITISSNWENPKLWWPDDTALYPNGYKPSLYKVFTILKEGKNQIIDTAPTRFGFREFWIDGTNFMINGKRINLKGGSHGWFSSIAEFTPVYLKTFYKWIKAENKNLMRITPHLLPRHAFNIADEEGLLIAEDSMIMGDFPITFNISKPETKTNFENYFKQWTQRTKNHPSLVIRNLENEMLTYFFWTQFSEKGKIDEKLKQEWKTAFAEINKIVKNIDNSRPTRFESDADFFDTPDRNGEIYDRHYPFDVFYNPKDFLNFPNNLYFAITRENNPARALIGKWKKDKPYTLTEFTSTYQAWVNDYLFYNDQVFDDYFYNQFNYYKALGEIESNQIKAYRYLNVAEISPWMQLAHSIKMDVNIEHFWSDLKTPGIKPRKAVTGHLFNVNPGFNPSEPKFKPLVPSYYETQKAFTPVAVFINEKDTDFYENTKIKRNYAIYNDELTDGNLRFLWELKVGSRVADSGGKTVFLKAGYSSKNSFTINLPPVKQRTNATIELKLYKDGKLKFEDKQKYEIYPISIKDTDNELKSLAKGKRIGVYDKGGKLKNILNNWKINYIEWKISSQIDNFDILILGKNSASRYDQFIGSNAEKIKQFVRNKGQVVLLQSLTPPNPRIKAPEYPTILPLDISVAEFPLTIAHQRAKGHEILNNLNEDDLKYWTGGEVFYSDEGKEISSTDNKIIENGLAKPVTGNFRTISDCGPSLEDACILELPYKKGNYILNQLLVLNKFNNAPQAAIVLKNTLKYALKQSNNIPKKTKTGIFLSQKNPLKRALSFMNAVYDDFTISLPKSLSEYNLIIVDDTSSPYISQLREYTKNGGKILIQDSSKEFIQSLTNTAIELKDPQVKHSQLLINEPASELIRGINTDDITWLKLIAKDGCGGFTINISKIVNKTIKTSSGKSILKEPNYTVNNIQQTCAGRDLAEQIRNNNIKISNPASALVQINSGNGFFLVNQVIPPLDTKDAEILKSASRYFSTLLTNLGAEITSRISN